MPQQQNGVRHRRQPRDWVGHCAGAGRRWVAAGDQRHAARGATCARRSTRCGRPARTIYCRGDVSQAADRAACLDQIRERVRPARPAGEQRRHRPAVAGRHSRRRPRSRSTRCSTSTSRGRTSSRRPSARWMIEQRAGRRGVRRLHHQHLVDLGRAGVDQPRRLLHGPRRHEHGHQAVGRAAGGVRHSRLRNPPRRHRHRHDAPA